MRSRGVFYIDGQTIAKRPDRGSPYRPGRGTKALSTLADQIGRFQPCDIGFEIVKRATSYNDVTPAHFYAVTVAIATVAMTNLENETRKVQSQYDVNQIRRTALGLSDISGERRQTGPSIVLKSLTFVRRASSVPANEFGARWRASRLDTLNALPFELRPERLVHCVVRQSAITPPWDGVEISWHSIEDRAIDPKVWTHSLVHDDAVLNDSPVIVSVEERIVSGEDWIAQRWRQGGDLGVVLFGFIEAASGFTLEAFRDYWWDEHRPLANSLVPEELSPVAYVHDYVLEKHASDDVFAWAGIGEMYERSLGTARRRGEWFESDAARPLAIDEERFMVRATRQVLVTDGEVLHRQPVG